VHHLVHRRSVRFVASSLFALFALMAPAVRSGADEGARRAGAASPSLTALAESWRHPEALAAGFDDGSVYASDSFGNSWDRVGDPDPGHAVLDLAIHPYDPRMAYAGTEDGLFRTTDRGATWSRLAPGLVGFTRVALDPTLPRNMYAVALDPNDALPNVYRSTDGGATWSPMTGIGDASQGASEIAVARSFGGLVYVASTWSFQCCFLDSLLFRSTNGGDAWSEVTPAPAPGGEWSSFAVSPRAARVAFASFPGYRGGASGVIRTLNGGSSWTQVLTELPDKRLVVLPDPATWKGVYVATPTGVLSSRNRGVTWRRSDSGLPPALDPVEMSADELTGDMVFVATRTDGVFMSTDGGDSWVAASDGLPVP
jgi:photosystem II stability/assembly factor-like uncharacterized protein